MPSSRYVHAVARNLAELQRAILNRRVLAALERERAANLGFLRLAYLALFNDYIAHCMKVFEESTRVASFWYLYRTDQHLVDDFAAKDNVDISSLKEVSTKLKHIRDRTHFHMDADAVQEVRAVWKVAGLTGRSLADAVDAAWSVVTHIQEHYSLPAVSLPSEFTAMHLGQQVSACAKKVSWQ
jgi:hypothetical protein